MFIEILLKLINERGITRTKFLNDVGLNKSCILNWQQRGTIPNGEVLTKIANYFDVSTDYLLGESNANKKLYMANSEGFLTKDERRILTIYKLLDDNGKKAVFDVLKKEHDRIEREKGLVPSTVAARSVDGSETVHTEYLPDLSEIPADDTDL